MSHAAATSQVGQVANYAAAVAALNAATTQEAQTTARATTRETVPSERRR